MKKIIIICSSIFLFMLAAACHTTKETSGSKDPVKNGETTNTWNSRKSFSKPKYKKVLKQRERIKDKYDGKKRYIFF